MWFQYGNYERPELYIPQGQYLDHTQKQKWTYPNMELSMLTVALGMIVCFTLPLLIITGVLVIILWRRQKAFDDNVESDATNTNVTMNSIDISKMSRVINSLYIALGLNNINKHLPCWIKIWVDYRKYIQLQIDWVGLGAFITLKIWVVWQDISQGWSSFSILYSTPINLFKIQRDRHLHNLHIKTHKIINIYQIIMILNFIYVILPLNPG